MRHEKTCSKAGFFLVINRNITTLEIKNYLDILKRVIEKIKTEGLKNE